ncbi:MAG: hypothetical protein KBF56_13200, partial [Gemmatimonadaceae bacterium]|nr:hypothetical protein [Gemmatimonadaceae bacterium]
MSRGFAPGVAVLAVAMSAVFTSPLAAQTRRPTAAAAPATPPTVAESTFTGLAFRNIGPANMSGRMADIEGVAGDPSILYAGSASGGIWKSLNAGTTWTPIFDKESVQSIGDLAVDPTNHEVVYVGTGEGNVRNSVSFGDG